MHGMPKETTVRITAASLPASLGVQWKSVALVAEVRLNHQSYTTSIDCSCPVAATVPAVGSTKRAIAVLGMEKTIIVETMEVITQVLKTRPRRKHVAHVVVVTIQMA